MPSHSVKMADPSVPGPYAWQMTMQLIPVLDILNGVVVRGVAGQRDQYRPIESYLTSSVHVLDVARAIRNRFGWNTFYIADLDAIVHGSWNNLIYRELIHDGFQLHVDAGVHESSRAQQMLELGIERVIIGLESCPSPKRLSEVIRVVTPNQLIFSLDLMREIPLASSEWSRNPLEIVNDVRRSGISQFIILDLSSVGTGQGVPTVSLCQQIRSQYGDRLHITTGGGVRDRNDLKRLHRVGVDGVLIASILHQPDCRFLIDDFPCP